MVLKVGAHVQSLVRLDLHGDSVDGHDHGHDRHDGNLHDGGVDGEGKDGHPVLRCCGKNN